MNNQNQPQKPRPPSEPPPTVDKEWVVVPPIKRGGK